VSTSISAGGWFINTDLIITTLAHDYILSSPNAVAKQLQDVVMYQVL
jgi:hypothetical protein